MFPDYRGEVFPFLTLIPCLSFTFHCYLLILFHIFTPRFLSLFAILLNSWMAESTAYVTTQLRLLWNAKIVDKMFTSLPVVDVDNTSDRSVPNSSKKVTEKGKIFSAFLI